MSSSSQWQQQEAQMQQQQQQQLHQEYLNAMSTSMQQQQHSQSQFDKHHHSIQLDQQQPPIYLPANQTDHYPTEYSTHSFASTSSASSSPLSARPHVSIHPQEFSVPFPMSDNSPGMHSAQSEFNADETILAGMGIHLGPSSEKASTSFSVAPFNHIPQYSQEQSAFAWPQSQSSHSIHSNGHFDGYGPASSGSMSDFAEANHHSSDQQQSITGEPGHNLITSYYHEPQQSSPSMQRIRKPARLNLQEQQQSIHHSSPSWTGMEVTTPNASLGFDQDQQQLTSTQSPLWQQTTSSQQQQQQQQQPQQQTFHYNFHRDYQSDSLGPAAMMQDSAIPTIQQNQTSGQLQHFNQLVAYGTPPEQTRPISRSSGISLASGSNQSSAPYSINGNNSQIDVLSDPSESSYFGQSGQSSGTNNPSWIIPSPSGSDSSNYIQNNNRGADATSQRKISTPQRLQQRRDPQTMFNTTTLASPGGMGHLHLSPATSMTEFDYTDHRLSAALASNARISSSVSDFNSPRNQRGNTTPTILEEEQVDSKQHLLDHTALVSSSPSQKPYMRNSPLAHAFIDQIDNVIKRHRSFLLQPNIFQQYSRYNSMDEPRQDLQDCSSFIDELMSAYLSTPSRLGLGERTVLIMTSKVAQKSYGQEKRFLCPPPMVILVGTSWWSSYRGSGIDGTIPILTPPRLTIAMSEQNDMQEANLEWASASGKLIDVGNPSCKLAISGRTIGKQLYINDADDKKRHCEALVHISVPGLSSSDRRSLGTFASKPIKVISKPSKKRQSSRTSDLSVNHGSTISLFHRLRSQTVSTRYLCVSGAPIWFKGSDGHPFLNTNENTHISSPSEPSSCFVAKMSSWDTFIIYLVDPHIKAPSSTSNKAPFQPSYPPPPINVLPRMANGQGQPICYNQAVVLQCLNTAVVSPVMIIRRVDRQTTVVGGGQSSFSSPSNARLDPTVEALGDPVSQLHKIAFEVLEDSSAPVPIAENRDLNTVPGQSGHFLGCLNEDVGLRKPPNPRQWVLPTFSGPSTPTTPITPLHMSLNATALLKGVNLSDNMDIPANMMSDTFNAANIAAAQTRYSLSQQRSRSGSGQISPSTSMPGPSSARSQYSSNSHSPNPPAASSSGFSSGEEDGTQVKRPRRVSSSVVVQKDRNSTAAKNRRRGQSLSIVGMQNQFQFQFQSQPSPLSPHQQHQLQQAAMQSTFPMTAVSSTSSNESKLHLRRTSSLALSLSNSESSSAWATPIGAMWTVDVHDSDVWTIVGTDIAQHTFYIPPKLVRGIKSPMNADDQGIAHLINVPAPATPITPMPVVQHFTGPNSSSSSSKITKATKTTYVTLTGDNLTNDFFVYFGDWRCTRVTSENDSTLYCEPPPAYEEFGLPRGKVPIILVRRDGVIFPTSHTYQC